MTVADKWEKLYNKAARERDTLKEVCKAALSAILIAEQMQEIDSGLFNNTKAKLRAVIGGD